jgi:hypothetical protein
LAEQLQIFYWYGHKPRNWRCVLSAFKNEETVRFLYEFYYGKPHEIPVDFKENILQRQCITLTTNKIINKLR